MNIINPPFSTAGSKTTAIRQYHLNACIPPLTDNHAVYVELFVCSGALFFNIDCRSAILNDKDDNVYNFWDCVQNNYAELMKELEFVWRGQAWLNKYKSKTDNISRAIAWYLQIRNNFGGSIKTTDKWYLNAKPRPFQKDFKIYKQKMDSCYLNIWNVDFREAMERINKHATHEREKYYIFEDPPYSNPNRNKMYNWNFTEQDHLDLADLNHQSPHWIFMTIDDTPLIRKLYADWYMQKPNWTYFAYKTGKEEEVNEELLLSNYPIQKNYRHKIFQSQKQSDLTYLFKDKTVLSREKDSD